MYYNVMKWTMVFFMQMDCAAFEELLFLSASLIGQLPAYHPSLITIIDQHH